MPAPNVVLPSSLSHPTLLSQQIGLAATFAALCAAAQPSPFAVPLAYATVFGVTDEHWRTFCAYCVSRGLTDYDLIAWGLPGVLILVYWLNGVLLMAFGAYTFLCARTTC